MCVAIPSRVTAIDGDTATVESFGVSRTVSLFMMAETVVPGDYVIVQSGAFAVEKVPPDLAEEALNLMARAMGPSLAPT